MNGAEFVGGLVTGFVAACGAFYVLMNILVDRAVTKLELSLVERFDRRYVMLRQPQVFR